MARRGLVVACGYAPGGRTASCVKQALSFFKRHGVVHVETLADDGAHLLPTKAEVMQRIRGTVGSAAPGDTIYIFVIGCGDEVNGGFLPCDYQTAGNLSRTEFKACIEHAPQGASLFVLSDLGNAGSVVDFPYRLTAERHPTNDQMLLRLDTATTTTNEINAVCLSYVKGKKVPQIGTLLTSFIACINLTPVPQRQQLLADIWHTLSQTHGTDGPMPRLSSTRPFAAEDCLDMWPPARQSANSTPTHVPTSRGQAPGSATPQREHSVLNPAIAETLQVLQGTWFTSTNTQVEVVNTAVHFVATGHVFNLKVTPDTIELMGSRILGSPGRGAVRIVWDDGDVWAKKGTVPMAEPEPTPTPPVSETGSRPNTPVEYYAHDTPVQDTPQRPAQVNPTPIHSRTPVHTQSPPTALYATPSERPAAMPNQAQDPNVSPKRYTPNMHQAERAVRASRDLRDAYDFDDLPTRAQLEEERRRRREQRDAERRDAELREAARRDAERREAGRRQAERHAALRREEERREEERREQERREEERREAERREAERLADELQEAMRRAEEQQEDPHPYQEPQPVEEQQRRRRPPLYPEDLVPLLENRAKRDLLNRAWQKWLHYLMLRRQYRRILSISRGLEMGSIGVFLARYLHKWRLWLVLRRPTTLPYRFRPVKGNREAGPQRIAVWLQKSFLAREAHPEAPDETVFEAVRAITTEQDWSEVQSEYEAKYGAPLLEMFPQRLSVSEMERCAAILLSNGVKAEFPGVSSTIDV